MMSFIFRAALSMAAVALPRSRCRPHSPAGSSLARLGFESNITDKSLMPRSHLVAGPAPVRMSTSPCRAAVAYSLARLEHCALSRRLVLSVRLCIYARAPVTGTWPFHVATVGAPELRLVVGESTVRAATLSGIRAASSSTTCSMVLCYVYKLLSESLPHRALHSSPSYVPNLHKDSTSGQTHTHVSLPMGGATTSCRHTLQNPCPGLPRTLSGRPGPVLSLGPRLTLGS